MSEARFHPEARAEFREAARFSDIEDKQALANALAGGPLCTLLGLGLGIRLAAGLMRRTP